ncbi:MAG: FMNH2-dependent monooxygenase [Jatrophihabitantaceae bacterium]|nr:FMNH2-dependent monooxygenase [Jatrophihabitantaceae bacterium]
MTDRFHLGWFFQSSTAQAWGEQWTGAIGRDWMRPDFHTDFARALERACFDYLLIEDSSYVADMWGGTMQIYVEKAIATPRQDPAVVASQMLTATSRIGIVPTLATFAYPPYILARLMGTLDQISAGRAGWNMVTGSSTRAAQNFGRPDQAEHDTRYEMADEYMAVVNGLWDSWAADSIVADVATGVFADAGKVKTIDFEGKYYKVRGPLNSGPLPQGRPAIAQAGASARGRQFAATHGHTIVCDVEGVDKMKSYRDDVRSRMAGLGRNPDECKVMYVVSPVIGGSEREAQDKYEQEKLRNVALAETRLAHFSKATNIDFSVFPLDEPLGEVELKTNGHQAALESFIAANKERTLRQAGALMGDYGSVKLVGTPDAIAGQMAETMDEVGGDGFLLHNYFLHRRYAAEVTDGLVPALQRRGLTRTAYEHDTLIENLQEF